MVKLAEVFREVRFQRIPYVLEEIQEITEFFSTLEFFNFSGPPALVVEGNEIEELEKKQLLAWINENSKVEGSKVRRDVKRVGSILVLSANNQDKKKKERPLNHVLADKQLFEDFKTFVAKNFNSENLLFYVAAHRFKTLDPIDPSLKDKAKLIYANFIDPTTAEFQIGLESETWKSIQTKTLSDQFNINMFDDALFEVEFVLRSSWTSFCEDTSND